MNSDMRRISTPIEKITSVKTYIEQLEAELAVVKAELARTRAIRICLEIELLFKEIEQLHT
jgi:glucosamine 6-phosphate synthetase-like amidotransferase/phosphosugar isomerase protein